MKTVFTQVASQSWLQVWHLARIWVVSESWDWLFFQPFQGAFCPIILGYFSKIFKQVLRLWVNTSRRLCLMCTPYRNYPVKNHQCYKSVRVLANFCVLFGIHRNAVLTSILVKSQEDFTFTEEICRLNNELLHNDSYAFL